MRIHGLRGALGDARLLEENKDSIALLLHDLYSSGNLEKLHNDETTYCYHVNDCDRLLFTVEKINGELQAIFLQCHKHKYETSPFLKKGKVKEYKAAHRQEHEALVREQQATPVPQPAALENLEFVAVDYYQNQWIELHLEQQEALHLQLPGLINGIAGSGKSCLAVIILTTEITEQLTTEEDKPLPIVYVAPTREVTEMTEKAYQELPTAATHPKERVQFKTINELIAEDSGVAEQDFVGKDYFAQWYNQNQPHQKTLERTTQKTALTLTAEQAYAECRIASGYQEENYLNLAELDSCLPKTDSSRALLYKLFTRYRDYLADKIDPSFYTFKNKNIYSMLVVDEAHAYPNGILATFENLVENRRVLYLADDHQRLSDHASAVFFLSQRIPKQNYIELMLTFRSPLKVVSIANETIALKHRLAGGLGDKREARKIGAALPSKGTGWVSVLDEQKITTDPWLTQHLDKPYCAIVTLEEHLEEARRQFPQNVLVMTPEQMRGLEYDIVIAYKLDAPALTRLAKQRLEIIGDKQPVNLPKDGEYDPRFNSFLKQFYTACTRVKQLFILCRPWAVIMDCINDLVNSEPLSDHCLTHETTGSWEEQLQKHLRLGNKELACSIFVDALQRDPKDFEDFINPKPVANSTKATQIATTPEITPLPQTRAVNKSSTKPMLATLVLNNSVTTTVSQKPPTPTVQAGQNDTSTAAIIATQQPKNASQEAQATTNLLKDFSEQNLLALWKLAPKAFWTSPESLRIYNHLKKNSNSQKVFLACLINHYELIEKIPFQELLNHPPVNNNKSLSSALKGLQPIFAKCIHFLHSMHTPNKNNSPLLHLVVILKQGSWIRKLHHYGADMDAMAPDKTTAAHVAATYGHTDELEILHELKANLAHASNTGRTPAFLAAFHGRIGILKRLQEFKIKLDTAITTTKQQLIQSVQSYSVDIQTINQTLKKKGIRDNKTPFSLTPLETAQIMGYQDVVNFLSPSIAAATTSSTPLTKQDSQDQSISVDSLLAQWHTQPSSFWTSPASKSIYSQLQKNQQTQKIFLACLVNHQELINKVPYKALLKHEPIRTNKSLFAALKNLDDMVSQYINKQQTDPTWHHQENLLVHLAAQLNKKQWIRQLHAYGADLNKSNAHGETSACIAAQKGYDTLLELLAKLEADLTKANNKGETPALIAARSGHLQVLNLLHELKVNLDEIIDTEQGNMTVAIVAATEGCKKTIKLLFKLGVDFNTAGDDGITPIYVAAQNGNIGTVTRLKEFKAKIHSPFTQTKAQLSQFGKDKSIATQERINFILKKAKTEKDNDKVFLTATDIAYIMGHEDIVKLLFPFTNPSVISTLVQAPGHFTDDNLLSMWKLLPNTFWTSPKSNYIYNHLQQNPETQKVFLACLINHPELIDRIPFMELLKHQPIQANESLHTALKELEEIFFECSKKLQEHPNWQTKGNTVIHLVVFLDKTEWVRKLHFYGADLEKTNNKGSTPLYIAIANGHITTLNLLCELGVDIHKPSKKGITYPFIAAEYGQTEALKLLHRLQADLSKAANDGTTPVYIAAQNGHESILVELATLGISLDNPIGTLGLTPAFTAAQNGHIGVLKRLKECKVNLNTACTFTKAKLMQFSRGQFRSPDIQARINEKLTGITENNAQILLTPLDIAEIMGHENIVVFLQSITNSSSGNHRFFNDPSPKERQYALNLVNDFTETRLLVMLKTLPLSFWISAASECIYDKLKINQDAQKIFLTCLVNHSELINKIPIAALLEQKYIITNQALWLALKNLEEIVIAYQEHARKNHALGVNLKLLHFAARYGKVEVLKTLHELGADLDRVDSHGKTPAYIAAQYGHTDFLKTLNELGANLNTIFVLSVAEFCNPGEAMPADMQTRINAKLKDAREEKIDLTLLDIAKIMGHEETAEFLESLELTAQSTENASIMI